MRVLEGQVEPVLVDEAEDALRVDEEVVVVEVKPWCWTEEFFQGFDGSFNQEAGKENVNCESKFSVDRW